MHAITTGRIHHIDCISGIYVKPFEPSSNSNDRKLDYCVADSGACFAARDAEKRWFSRRRCFSAQILVMAKDIDSQELDFLLRFPAVMNVTSPVDFLSNSSWGGIKVGARKPLAR